MLVDVQVPVQGLTVTEATLVRWLKQPGESVSAGEPLFEIETDKAVQEIESPATGTLLSHGAAVGDVVNLGAAIGAIGTDSDDRQPAPESVSAAESATIPVAGIKHDQPSEVQHYAAASQPERRMVSPRARRAADRLGVDLATVTPSGARSHIRERDVVAAARLRVEQAPLRKVAGEQVPMSRARRITAERTASSFHDAPHYYISREVLAERLVDLREDLISDPDAFSGVRVSLTDLLVRALALAIRDCPFMNVQWQEDGIIRLAEIDIGLATGTPSGLYVPVIRSADGRSIPELARIRTDLVELARRGDLRSEEMAGGSMTLTNLGQYGVDQFQAVINPPQSAILATSAVKTRPFVVEETLGAHRTIILTLSVDHRVVDGTEAAEFLGRIVHRIERPGLLLV